MCGSDPGECGQMLKQCLYVLHSKHVALNDPDFFAALYLKILIPLSVPTK